MNTYTHIRFEDAEREMKRITVVNTVCFFHNFTTNEGKNPRKYEKI